MAGVRGAIQQLRAQQDTIQANIEKIDDEIREAKNENDKVEQTKLSLKHQETLLQQRIKKTEQTEKAKLDKISKLKANLSGDDESSGSLTAQSNDAYDRQDKLLNELKEARETATKNDMMYEEVKKRLLQMEQSRDRMELRAKQKEAEAKRLEEGFNAVNSQMENLKSKDFENDTELVDQVSDLQRKLDEAIRSAETAEREGKAFDQSIEGLKRQIAKQREENDKLRKEIEKMNEILDVSEP
ncbi:hypothetical protein Aperf_G00000028582 [Anoplocephala perfoliata]